MKKTSVIITILVVLVLAVGGFLTHQFLMKLEKSQQQALIEKDKLIKELKQNLEKKDDEISILKLEKQKVVDQALAQKHNKEKENDEVATEQKKLIQQLLDQSQKNLTLEDKLAEYNKQLQELNEKCTAKAPVIPKKQKMVHLKPAKKPEIKKEEPILKKSEPVKTEDKSTTIIINKVYVTDKEKGQTKLIKQEKQVLPKNYYPNDLLK